VVVGDEDLAEQDSSFVFLARFLKKDETQVRYVEVEGYVDAVVGGEGIRHWESGERQRV
jgi:hypothetical protein